MKRTFFLNIYCHLLNFFHVDWFLFYILSLLPLNKSLQNCLLFPLKAQKLFYEFSYMIIFFVTFLYFLTQIVTFVLITTYMCEYLHQISFLVFYIVVLAVKAIVCKVFVKYFWSIQQNWFHSVVNIYVILFWNWNILNSNLVKSLMNFKLVKILRDLFLNT